MNQLSKREFTTSQKRGEIKGPRGGSKKEGVLIPWKERFSSIRAICQYNRLQFGAVIVQITLSKGSIILPFGEQPDCNWRRKICSKLSTSLPWAPSEPEKTTFLPSPARQAATADKLEYPSGMKSLCPSRTKGPLYFFQFRSIRSSREG